MDPDDLTNAREERSHREKVSAMTALASNRYTHERVGAWGRSMERQSKGTLIRARHERNIVLVPFIGTILFVVFLVGPSITSILAILGTVNPIIWIVGVLVLIFMWRRFV